LNNTVRIVVVSGKSMHAFEFSLIFKKSDRVVD